MIVLQTLAIIAAGICGAIVYRWRGKDEDKRPKWLKRPIIQIVFILPLFALTWAHAGLDFALLAAALSTLACCTGHGCYMYLGRPRKKPNEDDEQMRPIVRVLTLDKLSPSDYWYQWIGLMLTGVFLTIMPAYFCGSFILLFAGMMKPLCYEVGWGINVHWKTKVYNGTEIGEVLWGYIVWGCSAAVAFIAFT